VSIIFTLDRGKIENKYIVKSINCDGDIRRRLLDLGIVPSSIIIPVLEAPFGDPIAYNVRGTLIAIRKEDSRYIEVEKAYEDKNE